ATQFARRKVETDDSRRFVAKAMNGSPTDDAPVRAAKLAATRHAITPIGWQIDRSVASDEQHQLRGVALRHDEAAAIMGEYVNPRDDLKIVDRNLLRPIDQLVDVENRI